MATKDFADAISVVAGVRGIIYLMNLFFFSCFWNSDPMASEMKRAAHKTRNIIPYAQSAPFRGKIIGRKKATAPTINRRKARTYLFIVLSFLNI